MTAEYQNASILLFVLPPFCTRATNTLFILDEKAVRNKHCCVLLNSDLSNATSKRPIFVEKRGNYCHDTAKIGICTPLKSDIYFRYVTETMVD